MVIRGRYLLHQNPSTIYLVGKKIKIFIHKLKKDCVTLEQDLSRGCGVLVGVSDLVTFVSLGVVKFELCALQKCIVTMRIALMYQEVPLSLIADLSEPRQ